MSITKKSFSDYGFEISQPDIDTLIAKAKQDILRLNHTEICEGQSLSQDIQCKQCFHIPFEPISECSKCENVICDNCVRVKVDYDKFNEIDQWCPVCDSKFIAKPLNRRVKDIAFNAIKFKHYCHNKNQENICEQKCLKRTLD